MDKAISIAERLRLSAHHLPYTWTERRKLMNEAADLIDKLSAPPRRGIDHINHMDKARIVKSSGCIWFDLNLPCEKAECRVCSRKDIARDTE